MMSPPDSHEYSGVEKRARLFYYIGVPVLGLLTLLTGALPWLASRIGWTAERTQAAYCVLLLVMICVVVLLWAQGRAWVRRRDTNIANRTRGEVAAQERAALTQHLSQDDMPGLLSATAYLYRGGQPCRTSAMRPCRGWGRRGMFGSTVLGGCLGAPSITYYGLSLRSQPGDWW